MKALYYRLKYAVMVFAKRAPVDRATYLTDSLGSPMTDSNGEVLADSNS
jgi:hypothetical protein